jgi:hypothetical protein
MGGYIRIEDISRGRIVGLHSLRSDGEAIAVSSEQLELELLVAVELLRATPKFWNVVALWVAALPDDVPGGYTIRITTLDGFPVRASVTSRLRAAIARLFETMETRNGGGWSGLVLQTAWTSPRTWAYDVAYEYQGLLPKIIDSSALRTGE